MIKRWRISAVFSTRVHRFEDSTREEELKKVETEKKVAPKPDPRLEMPTVSPPVSSWTAAGLDVSSPELRIQVG